MSIWREVRCDNDDMPSDCYSNHNNGPAGYERVSDLHRQAKADGWLVKGGKAFCPNCRERTDNGN